MERIVEVVAAVIEYQGRVLLARNAGWPAKMFALVTGFLERDDAIATTTTHGGSAFAMIGSACR